MERPEGACAAEESLLTRAMHTPHHLACIAGADIGAVIPLPLDEGIVVGRQGAPPLSDPRASRVHARVRGLESGDRSRRRPDAVAQVQDLSSTNGVRISRRGVPRPVSLRLHKRGVADLREGDVLHLGGDAFEVRPRPQETTWSPPPPPRPRLLGRSLLGLPLLLVLTSFLWRMGASSSPWVWVLAGVLGSGVLAGLAWRWRRNRSRWERLDAAHLSLVTRTSAVPPPGGVVSVWVARTGGLRAGLLRSRANPPRASPRRPAGRASSLGVRLPGGLRPGLEASPSTVLPSHKTAQYGGATAPAAVGGTASLSARWWVAQLAHVAGGVTVTCEDGEVRRIGEGNLPVHLVTGEVCGACMRGAAGVPPRNVPSTRRFPPGGASDAIPSGTAQSTTLHVGAGLALKDVPSWCDRVLPSWTAPVSWTWWNQVAHPLDDHRNQLPDVVRAEDLEVVPPASPGGLGVALGVGADGVVCVDLVEDGPHALVAGTTGSGKSEALTTWLVGLCRAHPPEQVRLVLVDYKGGATFAPLVGLPHCAHVLTDLDTSETERALRGIAALLRSRERQLAELGLPDWARWQRAHDAGDAPAPPPRVVIALDEFRVVAEAHPKMLDSLVRLAAQGRSLGLHLVLATQRPAGAVTAAMRANIELRVALRCADDADSLDVIGSVQAARIPRTPGRALLRDGTEFQVAWVQDVARAVQEIQGMCPAPGPAPEGGEESGGGLWAPPLPGDLTWAHLDGLAPFVPPRAGQGDSADAGGGAHPGPVLAMVDGIDSGAHTGWVWDGGHILVEGAQRDAPELSRAALALGRRIAAHLVVPVHVCSPRERQPGRFASWVCPDDASSCAHLLDEVATHGPGVVVIDDLGELLDSLGAAMGGPSASGLITRLLASASAGGVVLVVAAPASHHPLGVWSGAFSGRLVRIHSVEDSLRRGLPTGTAHTVVPGRFVFPRAERDSLVVQVPLGADAAWSASTPETNWWVEPLPRAVGPSSARVSTSTQPGGGDWVLLAGARLLPLRCHRRAPWFVVGMDEGVAGSALEDLHRRQRWEEEPEYVVVPAGRWTEVLTHHDHHVLALGASPDLVRALGARALTCDPAARVTSTSAQVGAVLHDGHLERVVLSGDPRPRHRRTPDTAWI